MIAKTSLNKISGWVLNNLNIERLPPGLSNERFNRLLNGIGSGHTNDAPITLMEVLRINGLSDAIQCLVVSDAPKKEMRLFAVWCARKLEHLMHNELSLKALDVAEAHANGNATDEELRAAFNDAWDAAYSYGSGEDVAGWAAASAAHFAGSAYAAYAASWNAMDVSAQEQERKFIDLFCTEE